jgi:hypothetical protein
MGWDGSGGLRQVRKESWIHKSYVCVGDGLFASEFDKAVRRYKTEVFRGTDWLHLVRHAGLHTTYCCAIRHQSSSDARLGPIHVADAPPCVLGVLGVLYLLGSCCFLTTPTYHSIYNKGTILFISRRRITVASHIRQGCQPAVSHSLSTGYAMGYARNVANQ